MSKQINLPYDGVQYTLMFTKKTLEDSCNMGINPDFLSKNPMMVVRLFHMAFMAKHPKMTFNKAQEIYYAQNKKVELMQAIIMLWNDVTDGILEDADESGNAEWTPNFDLPKEAEDEKKSVQKGK